MAKRSKKFPKEIVTSRNHYDMNDSDSYLGRHPVWSFKKLDVSSDRWSLNQIDDLYHDIVLKLRDYEGMTWQEIMSASGGRSRGTNNHFENVSDLCKDACDRINVLHMSDIDQVFSLRLSSLERLYGILEDGTYFVLWYDPNHEIYPVEK